jgi:hypothetical protein
MLRALLSKNSTLERIMYVTFLLERYVYKTKRKWCPDAVLVVTMIIFWDLTLFSLADGFR